MELQGMSLSELNELSRRAAELAERTRRESLATYRAETIKRIEADGYTLADLGFVPINRQRVADAGDKPKVRRPAKPKYRHPNNPEQTWTGRGKHPIWVRDALSVGYTLEQMLIRS